MKLVGVEFKKNGKQYTFNDNDLPLKEGDRVIVNTERGLQFGVVSTLYGELNDNKEHANVVKVANDKDEKQNEKNSSDGGLGQLQRVIKTWCVHWELCPVTSDVA